MKFPVNKPVITKEDSIAINDCISKGWISSDGPYVPQFEEDFSRYIGTRYALAVTNGTAALTAALYGIEIKPGDEIIMPSFTIISCVIGIMRFGAIPVLVDIEPDTWNINTELIKSKVTNKTKAIMAVHMYGHPCDMQSIMNIAEQYNLKVIEDSSQVHGASYKNAKCGSIGHVSTFSFYANKIITTGEGGMVLTNDSLIANRVAEYKNLCFDLERKYIHADLGDNLRMTSMQAALGISQLNRIDKIVEMKIENGLEYRRQLNSTSLKLQEEKPWANMVYWMYCIQFDEKSDKNTEQIALELKEAGIGSRFFFTGMHRQPALLNRGLNYDTNQFNVTEKATKYGLYLPSSIDLTKNDIKFICDALKNIINE